MIERDVTVTLTAEDIALYDRARAINLPTIVVSMYGDRIKMLLAEEREACAKVCDRMAAQRQPLTGDSTTFVQRFTDAVAIICGAEPPAEFVDEWLRNVEVDFVARLQEWVLSQDGAPQWAQGIVMLDAAYLLADSPQEGMRHEAAHSIGAKHD